MGCQPAPSRISLPSHVEPTSHVACKVDVLRARWMCCKVCFKTKNGKVFTKSFASTHHLLCVSSSGFAWAVSLHRPGFLYLLNPLLMLHARWMCVLRARWMCCKVCFKTKNGKVFTKSFAHHLLRVKSRGLSACTIQDFSMLQPLGCVACKVDGWWKSFAQPKEELKKFIVLPPSHPHPNFKTRVQIVIFRLNLPEQPVTRRTVTVHTVTQIRA